MADALRYDITVLVEMRPQGVDEIGALTHQLLAGSEQDSACLLVLGFDFHKAHPRTLSRLDDRLGVNGVILVALQKRLHVAER